jgi:hypothetical protein
MLRFSFICICFVAFLSGCSSFRQLGLYDKESDRPSKPEINGFSQLQIFQDELNADAWFTKSPNCIAVSAERKDVFSGDGAIHVKWNKQAEECPWMGLGFGWDGWNGKDLSQISQEAALTFWVKTNGKPLKELPWAIGMEDFSGNQQWVGFAAEYVVKGPITDKFTQVLIPLEKFRLLNGKVDVYSIKQLIIQFESSGEVIIDNICIQPWNNQGL